MIVHMRSGIAPDDAPVKAICEKAERLGLRPDVHSEAGAHHTALEIYLKDDSQRCGAVPDHIFENMDGVKQIVRITPALISMASNGVHEPRRIQIGDNLVGQGQPCVPIIGTCTVDELTPRLVEGLAALGVKDIRGGWRKPRSTAFSYRGPGKRGLEQLLRAAAQNGIRSVWTEVIESPDIDVVRMLRDKTDFCGKIILWVGARNIGNYRLLEKLGRQKEFGVMLKNGLHMEDIDELLAAAGFVLSGPMRWRFDGALDKEYSKQPGNQDIVLCVRGLRNNDKRSRLRFYPNVSWISALHQETWAPVCFDPSHIAGRLDFVFEILADGLKHKPDLVMVEAHIDPTKALCDADQAVPIDRVPEILEMVAAHNAVHHFQEPAIAG